jgi:hypothetical protein
MRRVDLLRDAIVPHQQDIPVIPRSFCKVWVVGALLIHAL